MALITPVITDPVVLDATIANDIVFVASSGDQVVANNLVIQLNSDNTEIYNQEVTSFVLSHNVPLNTLTNSTEYKCRVRTKNSAGTYSTWSDWVVFWCYAPPTVAITNIVNAVINNQTYSFVGSYTSDSTLESYRYTLYTSASVLIESFDELYDGLLTQQITGLENGITYKLCLTTMSVDGLTGTSGLITFTPNYSSPRLTSALTIVDTPASAGVTLTASVIQVLGSSYPTSGTTLTYVSNDWVDLTDGNAVLFDTGFTCDTDFILKIWCKTLTEDETFLTLYGDYGTIKFKQYQNKIHAYKYLTGSTLTAHFASNALASIASTDVLFVWVKQISDAIDIQIEIIP